MPFNQRLWDSLCREELESLRNGDEVATFRHMKGRFETICRRMIESGGQPDTGHAAYRSRSRSPLRSRSRSPFRGAASPPRRQAARRYEPYNTQPGGRVIRNLTNNFRQRLRFGDRPNGAIRPTGANAEPTGRLRSVVDFHLSPILIVTNGDAASFVFRPMRNVTEKKFGTLEEAVEHLQGLETKPSILFVIWEAVLTKEKLQEVVDAGKASGDFFRISTETPDEDADDVKEYHEKMPVNRRDMDQMGRKMLKAAQDTGLKPTRVPVKAAV